MYSVSDAYKKAIQDNTRSYYWTGKITTTAGIEYPFENKDIVKGSGYITNQCCGNSDIELGTVYAAELGISLYTDINRYTLYSGKLEVYFHLDTGGSYETIPMGIFEISEANRSIKCLEIKAYDYMLRFEEAFSSNKVTRGASYDLLSLACKECKVELKNTKEELEAMPNGNFLLDVYYENDIETWRDLIYYVAQALGAFATINREGKLELRKYGSTSILEIPHSQRFTSNFSDFVTRYTAVSSTNLRTQENEYYALETDDGLTMNLGTNPLLQYGTASRRQEMLNNILFAVSIINYVPFDSSTIGNPALDLGDIITLSGGQADGSKITCVTGYTFNINGKHQIKCVGKNPMLSQAKSKNDKSIAGLSSQIESGKIISQTFVNASELSVGTALTEIISLDFVTNEDTSAQLHASVIISIKADDVTKTGTAVSDSGSYTLTWKEEGKAEAEITYKLNDNVIESFKPKETWYPGNHMLSLFYPLDDLEADKVNEVRVSMRMISGTAVISRGCLVASIYGQGIAVSGKAEWDGYIRVTDSIPLSEMGLNMLLVKEASCISKMQVETIHSYSDTMSLQNAGAVMLKVVESRAYGSLQVENINALQDTVRMMDVGFTLLSVSETVTNDVINAE